MESLNPAHTQQEDITQDMITWNQEIIEATLELPTISMHQYFPPVGKSLFSVFAFDLSEVILLCGTTLDRIYTVSSLEMDRI